MAGKLANLFKNLNMETKNYRDNRGVIETLCKNVDVLRITSKAGTERANHWHKTSNHWCLVTKGIIEYFERPTGENVKPTVSFFEVGDLFYTGPMVEHTMFFPEDTEFYCFSGGDRTQEAYENDLVRFSKSLKEVYNNYA